MRLLLAALCLLLAGPALAQQSYPDRPVRVVVPYSAGGPTDTTARLFAEQFSRRFGQPFVVENRVGGGTSIGAALVARAAPDGYTLFISNFASNVVNGWLRRLDYDPAGFSHAGMLSRSTMFLMVAHNSPIHSVADLVRLARQKPGGLTFATNGAGTPNHLLSELLRLSANIPLTHVPYTGSSQSNLDLTAGRVDFMFDANSMILSGQARGVAVADTQRWPTLPNLPIMAEAGYPEVALTTFFGLAAPANTPEPILESLHAAIVQAAADATLVQRMGTTGFVPFQASRAETAAFIARESTKWRAVIADARISVE